MKATPYLVVDGGYAGLSPCREVAEGHQCILGAALVGVDVVLPCREAEGSSWHPVFGTGTVPRGAIPAQLVAHPRLQPPSSWHAAWLPSHCSGDAHETQLSSSPKSSSLLNCKDLPVPLCWLWIRPALPMPGQRAGWIWVQCGGTPCAPQYRQAGWGEPEAAPCRWLLGWFWCRWDARQGLAAPVSGCPAEPRPQCNSGGWRDKLGAERESGGYNLAGISPPSYFGQEHHQVLRDGMGHAGDKDKHGGRGINHICLLFVQGPWSL